MGWRLCLTERFCLRFLWLTVVYRNRHNNKEPPLPSAPCHGRPFHCLFYKNKMIIHRTIQGWRIVKDKIQIIICNSKHITANGSYPGWVGKIKKLIYSIIQIYNFLFYSSSLYSEIWGITVIPYSFNKKNKKIKIQSGIFLIDKMI